MARKFFGTDGIRGRANVSPMSAEMILRLGAAVGYYFSQMPGAQSHRVIIGKDTRLSGYMYENALTAGLTSTGMNVLLLGPVPTPAVGLLTSSMRADLGVMISASHNVSTDNGIKFFGPDGFKLSDQVEMDIERLMEKGVPPSPAHLIGRAKRVDDGRFRYMERIKRTLPLGMRFDNLKIVVDCANGAGYRAAPEALWELGANVIAIGVDPNGHNINDKCGSTDLDLAIDTVIAHGADVGVCLDGDADRVIIIDETGTPVDGDQLMALMATAWAKKGMLKHNALVSTVMSNLGLERYLQAQGIDLHRTKVGDRYVVEHMRKHGFNLGGEQSGHIVMNDYSTTGDGLLAGLHFIAQMVEQDKPASALVHQYDRVPQILKNVRYDKGKDVLHAQAVQQAITQAQADLKDKGRLLIRTSGTEPVIRVMAECEDERLMERAVDDIIQQISNLS